MYHGLLFLRNIDKKKHTGKKWYVKKKVYGFWQFKGLKCITYCYADKNSNDKSFYFFFLHKNKYRKPDVGNNDANLIIYNCIILLLVLIGTFSFSFRMVFFFLLLLFVLLIFNAHICVSHFQRIHNCFAVRHQNKEYAI